MWINHASGFAYFVPSGKSQGLAIQNVSDKDPVTHLQQENVHYFTASPDGKHLFVVGDINDSLGADIWEYDVETKALRCVVPASDKPWQYSKFIRPLTASVQLSETKPVNVVIYPPAGYGRRSSKKYPVVMTSIAFAGAQPYLSQYAEAVANAGAYFVDVDRPWNFRTPAGYSSWEANINDITSYLLSEKTLSLDKHRLFVLSNSAQSLALMNVLTNHAGLYPGAICLVPAGRLASPAQLEAGRKPLKILVSTQEGGGAGCKITRQKPGNRAWP